MDEERYNGDNSLHENNPGPSSSPGSKGIVWQYLTSELNADFETSKLLTVTLMTYYV